jgi:hypothetical protein
VQRPDGGVEAVGGAAGGEAAGAEIAQCGLRPFFASGSETCVYSKNPDEC